MISDQTTKEKKKKKAQTRNTNQPAVQESVPKLDQKVQREGVKLRSPIFKYWKLSDM